MKLERGEEKYFALGRLEHPRQDKFLFYRYDEHNEPTKENPFDLYSKSPHVPQFQKSAEATPPLSGLSDPDTVADNVFYRASVSPHLHKNLHI